LTDVLPARYFIDPGPYPHEETAQLRSQCPVHRIDNPPGADAYAVLGSAVIEEAFCDPRLSKEAGSLPERYRDKALAKSLLMVRNLGFADPPEHTRLRKPISRAFLPAAIARLEPRIAAVIDDLIDELPAHSEVDLFERFALPMPLIVICEYLGIPVADLPLFQRWSYVLSQDPFQLSDEDLKTASDEFSEYFTALIQIRRRDLRDDLLSELVYGHDAGMFSLRELLSTILLLIIAGHKTVANMVTNGTALLLQHPEQLAMLRADPSGIPAAIEEILRFEGSAAWASLRIAAQDMELGGVRIPKGAFVHLSLASAGHDPQRFDDPERFDIMRTPKHHLGFGHGAHFCVGAPLARLQGRLAFSALLRRLPGFELAVAPEELVWLADSSLSRGLEALPLRLGEVLPR
jgi:cytochrome P450